MALTAVMFDRHGRATNCAWTGPDGSVRFADEREAQMMGLLPGVDWVGAASVYNEDLDRDVSPADGDNYIIALPTVFHQGVYVELFDDEDDEDEDVTLIERVVWRLRRDRVPVAEAVDALPKAAGLYAVWGDHDAWNELGLEGRDERRPLYVGKAEQSLRQRDGRTHFCAGKTGQSTLRRTVAALLRDAPPDDELRARPRNSERPERFANFGLDGPSEAWLQAWMEQHLTVSWWAYDSSYGLLVDVERQVIQWEGSSPLLNIRDAHASNAAIVERVSAHRRRMAADAKAWADAQSG